jgi:hypothetical protein
LLAGMARRFIQRSAGHRPNQDGPFVLALLDAWIGVYRALVMVNLAFHLVNPCLSSDGGFS